MSKEVTPCSVSGDRCAAPAGYGTAMGVAEGTRSARLTCHECGDRHRRPAEDAPELNKRWGAGLDDDGEPLRILPRSYAKALELAEAVAGGRIYKGAWSQSDVGNLVEALLAANDKACRLEALLRRHGIDHGESTKGRNHG